MRAVFSQMYAHKRESYENIFIRAGNRVVDRAERRERKKRQKPDHGQRLRDGRGRGSRRLLAQARERFESKAFSLRFVLPRRGARGRLSSQSRGHERRGDLPHRGRTYQKERGDKLRERHLYRICRFRRRQGGREVFLVRAADQARLCAFAHRRDGTARLQRRPLFRHGKPGRREYHLRRQDMHEISYGQVFFRSGGRGSLSSAFRRRRRGRKGGIQGDEACLFRLCPHIFASRKIPYTVQQLV